MKKINDLFHFHKLPNNALFQKSFLLFLEKNSSNSHHLIYQYIYFLEDITISNSLDKDKFFDSINYLLIKFNIEPFIDLKNPSLEDFFNNPLLFYIMNIFSKIENKHEFDDVVKKIIYFFQDYLN